MKTNFILILIGIFLSSTAISQKNNTNTWTTYDGEKYKIDYPDTWRLEKQNALGAELFIFSPLENDADQFSENINIMVQDLTGMDIDLAKFKEITEEQLRTLNSENKIFESTLTKHHNTDAYRALYNFKNKDLYLSILQICYIRDDKAYVVTFSANVEKFESYRELGLKIINSFKLK